MKRAIAGRWIFATLLLIGCETVPPEISNPVPAVAQSELAGFWELGFLGDDSI